MGSLPSTVGCLGNMEAAGAIPVPQSAGHVEDAPVSQGKALGWSSERLLAQGEMQDGYPTTRRSGLRGASSEARCHRAECVS